jgi:hypothetical protein
VLAHKITGIAGVYNRYSYLSEKMEILETWGKNWVTEIEKSGFPNFINCAIIIPNPNFLL